MLLVNISTDKVLLADNTHEQTLDRNGIEDVLWPVLLDWHRDRPFDSIFLINGPGGFTNLRVGSLMLNMLNAVLEKKIQIYSTDKLALFAQLVDRKILPPVGAIYLGQKHKVWLVDFAHKPLIPIDTNINDIPADAFLDEVYDSYRPTGVEHMVHFSQEKDKVFVSYQDKKHEISIQDLHVEPSEHVEAKYMIEPVLN